MRLRKNSPLVLRRDDTGGLAFQGSRLVDGSIGKQGRSGDLMGQRPAQVFW
jgi:hypothetical protein